LFQIKIKELSSILEDQIQTSESLLGNFTLSQVEAPPPINTQLRVSTAAGLNIRNKPSTDGAIIQTIPQGTIVISMGRAASGSNYVWWLVKLNNGKEGWGASDFLTRNTAAQCTQRPNYPLYKQCDGRWGGDKLGASSTICRVGCLMSSMAMAMQGLGKKINGQNVTPKNLNAFLMGNGGYSGNLFVWGAVSRFGFSYLGQPTAIATIKQHICNNRVVIMQVDQGRHWVLAKSVNADGSIGIMDPSPNRNSVRPNEVLRAGVYSY